MAIALAQATQQTRKGGGGRTEDSERETRCFVAVGEGGVAGNGWNNNNNNSNTRNTKQCKEKEKEEEALARLRGCQTTRTAEEGKFMTTPLLAWPSKQHKQNKKQQWRELLLFFLIDCLMA
tara:strand:- start:58 stop:420 length:363 start_codon:yes stop_codon:yes gene_type:complete